MTTAIAPGPFAGLISDELGEVTVQPNGRLELRFERRLKKPIEKVWAAITIAERIADWFTPVEIDLRVGGHYRIRFEGMDGVIEGEVLEVLAPRRFVHTWPDEDPTQPASVITYELEPDGDGCRLRFSQTEIPRKYSGVAAGWHTFFEALPGAAEGIRTPWSMEREQAVGERYRDVLAALPPPKGA